MNGEPLYSVGRNGYISAFFLPKGQEYANRDRLGEIQGLLAFFGIAILASMFFFYLKGR